MNADIYEALCPISLVEDDREIGSLAWGNLDGICRYRLDQSSSEITFQIDLGGPRLIFQVSHEYLDQLHHNQVIRLAAQ